MQYTTFRALLKKTIILSTVGLSLSGCDNWYQDKNPVIPATQLDMAQKQAIWTRFIGYNPDPNAVELSTFTSDFKVLIAKQSKQVLALDTAQGNIQWRATTGYALTNSAATDTQKVFIATTEPRLLALHHHNGKMAWSVPLPNVVLAKPCITPDYIIVKTISGEVLAFHLKNGKPAWQYKHPASTMMLHTSSTPVLYQDYVFVGFPDGKLVALDKQTGVAEWQHTVSKPTQGAPFSQLIDIATDPQIENNTLYVNTYQGKLQALTAQTGEVQWEIDLSSHCPLVLGQYLYTITDENKIVAFDKQSGQLMWEQVILKDRRLSGPILTTQKNHLIVADDRGTLYWLSDKTGDIIGKISFTIASPILKKPLVHNDKLFAITRRGQIAAWQYPEHIAELPKPVEASTEETTPATTEATKTEKETEQPATSTVS